MANRLGVYFVEKDQSQTISAIGASQGAMAIYSERGPQDKAYLCRSEADIRRLFGNPHEKMTKSTGSYDYGRSLQNAFQFVRAGIPMWFMRALASKTTEPTKATVNLHSDGSSHYIVGTALGAGNGASDDWYNNLRVVVTGIESVKRTVALTTAKLNLEDNILPGSLNVTIGASSGDDKAYDYGDTSTAITVGVATVTVTYEDATNSNLSTLALGAATATAEITYQRTNLDHVVRLYIVEKAETDKAALAMPTVNYLETFLVSMKETGKDDLGNSIFIEDVMNGVSEIFSVAMSVANQATLESAIPKATDPDDYSDALVVSGGTGEDYSDSDADITTALDEFRKKEYDILYMFDAGFHDDVKKKIAAVCRERLFPHGYIDPDMSLFVENGNKKVSTLVETESARSLCVNALVKWRSGLNIPSADQEFVSLSGSTWGLITDTFNGGRKLWMPPSYWTGYNAIVNDESIGAWNAVMGPRRGVTGFEKLAINLYDFRNELNVKQINGLVVDERGIQMFYGNKTMKVTASAMQNTHARKTRGRLSREYYFACLDFIAEFLDVPTFNDLQSLFESITSNYKDGLDSYSIVVGPPKTTTQDISQQRLRIGVGLIFKEIGEEIEITTTVFKQGVDLSVAVA